MNTNFWANNLRPTKVEKRVSTQKKKTVTIKKEESPRPEPVVEEPKPKEVKVKLRSTKKLISTKKLERIPDSSQSLNTEYSLNLDSSPSSIKYVDPNARKTSTSNSIKFSSVRPLKEYVIEEKKMLQTKSSLIDKFVKQHLFVLNEDGEVEEEEEAETSVGSLSSFKTNNSLNLFAKSRDLYSVTVAVKFRNTQVFTNQPLTQTLNFYLEIL